MKHVGAVLVMLAVSGTLVPGCGKKDAGPEQVIRPVRYQQVYAMGGDRERSFSGVAEASMESRLSFKVSGTVRRVPVKVGDTVQAGQLLAELDPEDYDLQVQEAQASLARAQAEARNAEADYGRVRALYENSNASKNDLDAARAGSESAQAQVKAAEKHLELARLQKSYTRLNAPADGAIADVTIEVNENVSPGQPVVLLTAGSEIEVRVSVPEALIASVREGEDATAQFDALPGQRFAARVTEVGVAPTGGATTYPVKVTLVEVPETVRPGMAATVNLRSSSGGSGADRYVVPPGAVGEDQEGRFVFLVEETTEGMGVAHRHPVRVGELTDQGLEITEGVSDGDLLVTAGVTKLEDGQAVRLTTAP